MSQNGWIAVIIALLIIAAGAWWFTSQPAAVPTADNSTQLSGETNTTPTGDTGTLVGGDAVVDTTPTSAVVTYNGSSFSPSEVTIKKGGTVTFNGPSTMWVASGPHPEHTNYDGTTRNAHCAAGAVPSFDQCAAGTSYTFTFDKVGTWPFHDHRSVGAFGKIVVVE
ncbi:hypothetical protein HY971_01580 [Candidatus Kaiserbacteria bacterium]|nr:hypothetical protein [Candidatus Kaiserbacteria bacterium]